MSETFFPVTDLLRRRLQTSLAVATLALSVASTLSLLLFCDRVGFGIFSTENILTEGLIAIFSQFAIFVGILIFAVGAVVTAFIAFLMTTQRTRDFGLMKAAGCPNGLVAGYFMTELLLMTLIGCTLGILSGVLVDYLIGRFGGFQAVQKLPNYWLALIVFVAFFVLALVFGTKPILNAARMSPIKALSPVSRFGLTATKKFKPISGYGITWKLAYRSLERRQSATLQIVVLLSVVFILTTVVVAGGIIASDTTIFWIEKTLDRNTIIVANTEMATQYVRLMSKFSSGDEQPEDFMYSDGKLGISDDIIQQIRSVSGVSEIDARLILKEHVHETTNFTIDPETLQTFLIGDNREADSLIVGIYPQKISAAYSVQGRTFSSNSVSEAIIGDSIAHAMFSPNPSKGIVFSNPLVQGVRIRNEEFGIVGVSVDPINNGQVIYVPIQKLKNITEIVHPNIVFVSLGQSVDSVATVAEMKSKVVGLDPNLDVFKIAEVADRNVNFLRTTWSTIMLLPLFTLISAILCLTGYMMIVIEEQKPEFATLRAIGGKPRLVTSILAFQSFAVLLSGFALGVSLGVVFTLLILMPNPLVTSFTVIEIATSLFSAVALMFVFTLYPAFRIARSSILVPL